VRPECPVVAFALAGVDILPRHQEVLSQQFRGGEGAIGSEIEEQNAMLDELDANVDKYGNKLGKAKKQLNRLG